MRVGNRRKLIIHGCDGVLVTGAVLLLYFFDPAGTAIYPPCPFHFLTGHFCPGCGSLRAVHNLLHGHLAAALLLNPLMVVSVPIVGVMLLNPTWIYKWWVPWLAFTVLVGYGIARNIPMWPLNLLAPR